MLVMLSSLLVSAMLWGADPPPPTDGPPDGNDGPPKGERDDRGPRGRGRGPRGGGPNAERGPRGGGFDVDLDFRRGPGGPPPPPLEPFRDGENWVIFGVIKTSATGETAPFDPSKGPVELELKDGRKITIDVLPPPPHPPGPPPHPPGPPRGPRGPGDDGPPRPPGDGPGDHGPPHGEHGHHGPGGPDGPHGPPFGPPGFGGPDGPGPGGLHSLFGDEIRPFPPDPEVLKLDSEEREIQKKLQRIRHDSRKPSSEVKEETRKEVLDLVTKQFDLRQQIRRKVFERIQKDSENIEASLQKREGQKQQLIDQRVKEILDPGAVDF